MRPTHARRLAPNQVCELVIADRSGDSIKVVYETSELIEAPNWSPDGKWLIFNADGRLFKISPDGMNGPNRINTAPVENLNNDHVISPDGRYLYLSANDGHLYRCTFNGGVPEKVSNDFSNRVNYGHYLHGISPDGKSLAYVGIEYVEEDRIARICTIPSAGGEETVLTDGSCPVDGPEFSADGEWIYFNSEAAATKPGHAQIFRMKTNGSNIEQLTSDERVNWFPHSSPDGTIFSYISFPENTLGHPEDKDVVIKTMSPDGTNQKEIDKLNGGQGTINVASWSPDSSQFAYVRYPYKGNT